MLETQLSRLESGDLIRQLSDTELAYLFKHALVQDTARASLLLGERKRLHNLVGTTLETLYPERRVELAPLLAQHFEASGLDAKTLEYATLAGDAAARVSANAEAIEYYTLALRVGERTNLASAEMQNLYLKRGRTLELQGNFKAALANYDELTALAAKRQDRSLELAALIASATIYSIPSTSYDRERSNELIALALELARTLNDKAAQATILWNLMLVESRVGAGFVQALEHGQAALKIAQENHLVERTAYVLNDLAPLLAFRGQPELAVQYNLESRDMWIEMGNMPMLADNFGYSVMIHLVRGEYDTAIAHSQEGYRLSREINNGWNEAFSQSWIGEAYVERGDIARAEQVMLNAIELGPSSFPPCLVVTRSDLSRLYTDLGMPERGIELARQALEVAQVRFMPIRGTALGALIEAHMALGQLEQARTVAQGGIELTTYANNPLIGIKLALAMSKLSLAESAYARALALSREMLTFLTETKIRQFMPHALMLTGRALLASGQVEPAAASLYQALQVALDMQAQWSLWQVYALLARTEELRGNADTAAGHALDAQNLIESLASRSPEAYRARFIEYASRAL